jgi:hypothetical protein
MLHGPYLEDVIARPPLSNIHITLFYAHLPMEIEGTG